MAKDMGERCSRMAGIDPEEWPVLAALFDHTVWIKARTWQAEQMEREIEKSRFGEDSASGVATRKWLEESRKDMRAKYADKIKGIGNGS